MKDASKPEGFITMFVKLQEDCGVADLKMSDYGLGGFQSPVEPTGFSRWWVQFIGIYIKMDGFPNKEEIRPYISM